MRRLRDEQGAILLIMGLVLPVLILMAAFAIEVGSWYVHKRSLQNRADAAAFAAGASYATRFPACTSNPTLEGQIVDEANRFAGKPGVAGAVNTAVGEQSRITVSVNGSDNVAPCQLHVAADGVSGANRYWTNVKVKEDDVGGLVTGLTGVAAPDIAAEARVELRNVVSAPDGVMPFVAFDDSGVTCTEADVQGLGDDPITLARVGSTSTFAGAVPDDDDWEMGSGPSQVRVTCGGRQYYVGIIDTFRTDGGGNAANAVELELRPGSTGGGFSGCANPYFVAHDAVACRVRVEATVIFSGPAPTFVRARFGENPGGPNASPILTLTRVGSTNVWAAERVINPLDGESATMGNGTDGVIPIYVSVSNTAANNFLGPQQLIVAGNAAHVDPLLSVTLVSAADNTTQARAAEVDSRLADTVSEIRVTLRQAVTNASASLQSLRPVDCNVAAAVAVAAPNCGPVAIFSGAACAASPLTCVTGLGSTISGSTLTNLRAAFTSRWASPCTTDNWASYPNLPAGDPRLILFFLTDSANTATTGSFHVTGLAGFYVRGWDWASGGSPCGNVASPVSGTQRNGTIWGHFVKFVVPSSSGNGDATPCQPSNIYACVATLVR